MAETKTGAERKEASRKEASRKAKTKPAAPPAREAAPGKEHVCNVAFCPIGLALTTMQGAAPDVVEHLLKATQELLLAARAVIDTRAKDVEGEPGESGLHRIEIS